ncbi:hypothetical protein [Nonomuraea turkmeniaca]|nr:hypothetical protein [Nonomuraea turkmeniaca]
MSERYGTTVALDGVDLDVDRLGRAGPARPRETRPGPRRWCC